jgi:hypothetical protein
MKFHENLLNGSRGAVPCGWIDRHDRANTHFSQLCEYVNNNNNFLFVPMFSYTDNNAQ